MSEERQKGIYDGRNFDAGPDTYNDKRFQKMIAAATGLAQFSGEANVLDMMSGPGKLGLSLQKTFPGHRFVFLDLSKPQLDKIPANPSRGRIQADARRLPLADGLLDVAVARYAIKDLTVEEQPAVLKQVFDSLKPGGALVIADMVAPEIPGAKEWLNYHHALKQTLGGRKEVAGKCHIPTQKEWSRLLEGAGFEVEVAGDHVSHVSTTDWVNGNQFGADAQLKLEQMNWNVLNASGPVKDEFGINANAAGVYINYPVTILRATKPNM